MEQQPQTEERVFLTLEQACTVLKVSHDGERRTIHCNVNPAPNLFMGADWPEADVHEKIRQRGAEASGPIARSMGHGLVVRDGDHTLFFATIDGWDGSVS